MRPPPCLNRANIGRAETAGAARHVISVSACGSFAMKWHRVILSSWTSSLDRDQLRGKKVVTFGTGCRRSCQRGTPQLGPRLGGPQCETAARDAGIKCTRLAGNLFWMASPQFSTLAESKDVTAGKLGADVIGMTNMPEAKLAREAELCYASARIESRL